LISTISTLINDQLHVYNINYTHVLQYPQGKNVCHDMFSLYNKT